MLARVHEKGRIAAALHPQQWTTDVRVAQRGTGRT